MQGTWHPDRIRKILNLAFEAGNPLGFQTIYRGGDLGVHKELAGRQEGLERVKLRLSGDNFDNFNTTYFLSASGQPIIAQSI
jgi:hypothetical protein